MIVNPSRFFVVIILVGLIGMTCEMYQEIQSVPYEQRMLERSKDNK